MEYVIEELIKTFEDHARKTEECRLEAIKCYEERNPGKPLPDYLSDAFNLWKALEAVCRELVLLKTRVDKLNQLDNHG